MRLCDVRNGGEVGLQIVKCGGCKPDQGVEVGPHRRRNHRRGTILLLPSIYAPKRVSIHRVHIYNHDRYAPTATLRAAQKKMLSKMALRRPDELRIGMRLGFRGY